MIQETREPLSPTPPTPKQEGGSIHGLLLWRPRLHAQKMLGRPAMQSPGQMVWYSHLLKNFPQFIVIHIVKVFGIASKAEIDVFLELSSFSVIQQMLAI